MSNPLSVTFAKVANAQASLAPAYPANMPLFSQVQPGCYGTFKNGIWSYSGTIVDFGVSAYSVTGPDIYNGKGTWNSEKMDTTYVTLKGGVWAVGEDGTGNGDLGVQFSTSSDTLFHVATKNLYEFDIADAVLMNVVGPVQDRKDSSDLRFVSKLIATDAYFVLGGVNHKAQVIVTGSAQALGDCIAGKLSGDLGYSNSTVNDLNFTLKAGNSLVPVGMVLCQISKRGVQVNNNPQ